MPKQQSWADRSFKWLNRYLAILEFSYKVAIYYKYGTYQLGDSELKEPHFCGSLFSKKFPTKASSDFKYQTVKIMLFLPFPPHKK